MDINVYKDIISVIGSHTGLSRDCKKLLVQRFPDVPLKTVSSILSLEYQKKMRKKHVKSKAVAESYMNKFNEGIKIVEIAKEADVAPALVARMILEEYCTIEQSDLQNIGIRRYVSELMKDTTKISDKRLSVEVYEAITFDSLYGPIADCIKRTLGEEYEQKLKSYAIKMNLSFRDELQLRQCGFDKTPDLKLEVPIAVSGHIVNWIESKASFADVETHKAYIKEQFMSYWNRFGPGLVIYWFGFVDHLENKEDTTLFIVRDKFPVDEIQFME
uniref:CDAN1-interacting nuclease 1 n=1 Tax=Xenopsylla cheopis TaxID=163159 RepID=A0A6M2DT18_XENCH